MGLKDEIFEALVGSIQPDNPGEDFIFSDAGVNKVDTLAEELRDAIVKWVKAQTFQITDMEAPVKIPSLGIQTDVITTGTAVAQKGNGLNTKPAFGFAQISDKGSKVDGRVGPAVTTSEVKLLISTKD